MVYGPFLINILTDFFKSKWGLVSQMLLKWYNLMDAFSLSVILDELHG